MIKFTTQILTAVLLTTSTISLPAAAAAEGLTKDLFRARVLDYCLYDQWARTKGDERKGILPDCRCAAKAYVNGLEKKELSGLLETGVLDRSQKKAVLTRFAKCRG